MKKTLITIAAAAALAVFCGCSSMVSVSPSTTPITDKDAYTKLGQAKATSQSILLLGILSFGPSSPSRTARNEALASKSADALIEVTEEFKTLQLILIQYRWTTVEGMAIKFANPPASTL